MKNLIHSLLVITLLFCSCQSSTSTEKTKQIPPNILVIIVDDLGYSDLGSYGGEIETKNIDDLANNGIQFSNFYASPNCSPSRAMLMSGMDHHKAGIGAMSGKMIGPNQKGVPGYEGYLNEQTVAFSELLKDEGYRNYYVGKWHLGTNDIAHPNSRGFDQAWWQVEGSPNSHFNLTPNKYIKQKTNYYENKEAKQKASQDFFSSNFYTDKLIGFLEKDTKKENPFLGVLSFSAVHIPIHCPQSHIDLYKGKYKEGYEELRKARLLKQKQKGIVANDVRLSALPPTAIPWDSLSIEEKNYNARRMEIYAGMVDNMDDNVGKLIAYLKKTEQYDNTIIFLMSDNGGAGFNGWQSPNGVKRFENANNSIENLGKPGSANYIGAGWGSATSTPFRLFKRHISEGGLRIPMIVSGGYLNSKPKFKKGLVNHNIFSIRDIAPTIQELVGVSYPSNNYKGRSILPQTGKSFSRLLKENPTQPIHNEDEIFGWELFKRKAVQKNGWKIIWIEPEFGKGKWELYHLKEDPTERDDLANTHPEKLNELIAAWQIYQKENNVIISNGELLFP